MGTSRLNGGTRQTGSRRKSIGVFSENIELQNKNLKKKKKKN